MSETQQAIERLLSLLSSEKMDVETLPLRLEQQIISARDEQYLALILGLLNKLFGTAAVLNKKTRANVQLNNTTCALFDSYESTLSADALAEKFQPLFDATLQGMTAAEKEQLLTRVDAISQVLADSVAVSRLALVWSYVNAVTPFKLAECQPMPDQTKKQVLALLIDYRRHLDHEINQAWPHQYHIRTHRGRISVPARVTNRTGEIFFLNAKRVTVREKCLPKNLLLLKQKRQAINKAIILLRDKRLPLTRFRYHFNLKIRPIIIRQRTGTDNKFLQDMMRLIMKPLRAISSFFQPKGTQLASGIQSLLAPLNTTTTRSLSHVN